MKALLLFTLLFLFNLAFATKKDYIVYLGGHSYTADPTSDDFERTTLSHYDLIGSILGSNEAARSSIFYSYTKTINGFVARLEDEEASKISRHPRVFSVFKNKVRKLHTTRSWDFMGGELNKASEAHSMSIWAKAHYGEGVIIANLDTGAWPESKSFNDEGLGPIPEKWKGICQNNSNSTTLRPFNCNRKLIGARSYNLGDQHLPNGDPSPRDIDGHGTHTLSTAGGAFVRGASIFGQGRGTARGGAPRARLAAYKICWIGCSDANILAAFDDAIHDGVQVISISVGSPASEYATDSLAIGALHAAQRGVIVVASGGNDGPLPGTVENVAPWILTVGASTIDRDFASYLTLGNNKRIRGESLSQKSLPATTFYPLIDGAAAKLHNASQEEAGMCQPETLDSSKVRGKIVLCTRDSLYARVTKGLVVEKAGGVGMVLANPADAGSSTIADAHLLPATMLSYNHSRVVRAYMKSTESPRASISPVSTQLRVKPSPVMAGFSSQGPNLINLEILKPDITAPGVNILAAFTDAIGPSGMSTDKRRVAFNVMSGTSMSCPHIAGIAALLRKLHPDWSPAAIKSAIMTTARTRDNKRTPMKDLNFVKATPFHYGAGHVRPNRAMDPGLVYDLTFADYVDFICTRGYGPNATAALVGRGYRCPKKPIRVENLNYPSIAVPQLAKSFTVTRRLKNVGAVPAKYRVTVKAPFMIQVAVEPTVLRFERIGEEKKFHVLLTSSNASVGVGFLFGGLTWSDGKHYVRSPITVNVVS
ncbi:subtilisin-like protease SBT5.3 [Zingiber officinale]|uniref:subtilisin-like protease SBT5.3 n=1 Tax=Zingiber officinale TaxID=94328 RepID=UPI001C4B6A31|nr:subtilisin-like protease SBT5.3 [Zingiber officinale]